MHAGLQRGLVAAFDMGHGRHRDDIWRKLELRRGKKYTAGIPAARLFDLHQQHVVTPPAPLSGQMSSYGNSTPGMEGLLGPIGTLTSFDGTAYAFEKSTRNHPASITTPLGVVTQYGYDDRSNLEKCD